MRDACGQLPPGQSGEAAREQRLHEITTIARAFAEASGSEIAGCDEAIGFLAKSSAQMVLVPVEDIVGDIDQPNLLGTIDGHPNWRRRYRSAADALMSGRKAAGRMARLAARRGLSLLFG